MVTTHPWNIIIYHGNKKNLQCVEQILFNKWHFIQKDDRTVTSSSTGRSIPLILAFILCMDIVSFVISTCKLSAVSYRSDDRALYILYKLIRKNIINIIASLNTKHTCMYMYIYMLKLQKYQEHVHTYTCKYKFNNLFLN